MLGKLETYFTDVMRGKKTGVLPSALKALLQVLSWVYRLIISIRNWGYDQGWFRQYQPPIPVVVSIGNIVVGGTGKTPVTLMLADAFYETATIGIISRGYRSPAEKLSTPIALSTGKGPLHSALYCGDEPYLISKNLPKAFIYVGKNRYRSLNMAAKAGVEIAILDDGMQHRLIGRDFDVVVVDMFDPFGLNYHFPRGFLRESPSSLSRADLVVINNVTNREGFERCRDALAAYTSAPVVGTRLTLKSVCDLQGNQIQTLLNKKVVLFCGIGKPDRFIETVKSTGAKIVGQQILQDHAIFSTDYLVRLSEKYKDKGAEMMVCTEKDKVKIPDLSDVAIPIVWLKMGMEIVENHEIWDQFVKRIRTDYNRRTCRINNCANVV